MGNSLSYMNKLLQATYRRCEPNDYASVLVLMALQNLMRNATKTARGKLWINVHCMVAQDEIGMEDADWYAALTRLERIGIIRTTRFMGDNEGCNYNMPFASFTAKGLSKLRATDWGVYPKSPRVPADV